MPIFLDMRALKAEIPTNLFQENPPLFILAVLDDVAEAVFEVVAEVGMVLDEPSAEAAGFDHELFFIIAGDFDVFIGDPGAEVDGDGAIADVAEVVAEGMVCIADAVFVEGEDAGEHVVDGFLGAGDVIFFREFLDVGEDELGAFLDDEFGFIEVEGVTDADVVVEGDGGVEIFGFVEVEILDAGLFFEAGVEEGAACEVEGLEVVGEVVGAFHEKFGEGEVAQDVGGVEVRVLEELDDGLLVLAEEGVAPASGAEEGEGLVEEGVDAGHFGVREGGDFPAGFVGEVRNEVVEAEALGLALGEVAEGGEGADGEEEFFHLFDPLTLKVMLSFSRVSMTVFSFLINPLSRAVERRLTVSCWMSRLSGRAP